MKFRPLHDRVVVKRVEEDTKTAGGIIIPDTVKEKPSRERSWPSAPAPAMRAARSFPPTSRLATLCCSANGRVPRSRSTDEDLLIMKESDILGVSRARPK